jgi:hypothetical protein
MFYLAEKRKEILLTFAVLKIYKIAYDGFRE